MKEKKRYKGVSIVAQQETRTVIRRLDSRKNRFATAFFLVRRTFPMRTVTETAVVVIIISAHG